MAIKTAIRLVVTAALVTLIGRGLSSAAPVTRIAVEGAKTRPDVILALLDTRVGAEFDKAVWEQDLRRLRNLDYFYEVEGAVGESDGKIELRLKLRNKFSTLPVFKFKSGGGASLFTAGLYEINFLNRLLEVGGQYERFNGKPGQVLWFRHPYFLSRRNKLGTEVLVHTVNLPLLTDKGVEEAFFENKETRWNGRLQRELGESLRVGAEIGVYRNEFTRDDATTAKAASNDRFLRSTTLRSASDRVRDTQRDRRAPGSRPPFRRRSRGLRSGRTGPSRTRFELRIRERTGRRHRRVAVGQEVEPRLSGAVGQQDGAGVPA